MLALVDKKRITYEKKRIGEELQDAPYRKKLFDAIQRRKDTVSILRKTAVDYSALYAYQQKYYSQTIVTDGSYNIISSTVASTPLYHAKLHVAQYRYDTRMLRLA